MARGRAHKGKKSGRKGRRKVQAMIGVIGPDSYSQFKWRRVAGAGRRRGKRSGRGLFNSSIFARYPRLPAVAPQMNEVL